MRPGSGCGYREACCHGNEWLSSHRGGAVTAKERDVVTGNNSGKEAWQVLVVWAGLLTSFVSICVVVCTPCAFLE